MKEQVFEITVYDRRGVGRLLPKITKGELVNKMGKEMCLADAKVKRCEDCNFYELDNTLCKWSLLAFKRLVGISLSKICSAGSSNGVCDSKNQKSEQQNER